MAQTSVAVIVVTFNSQEVIGKCLAGIPSGCPVYVVDNSSSDRTCAVVEDSGRPLRLLRMAENVGFGSACNRALHEVATPYALLLNPDAAITAEGLNGLVAAMKSAPEVAILSPRLTEDPAQPAKGSGCVLRDVEQVAAACMIIDRTKLAKTGFFDENFFLYYEDTDLCFRARAAGFRVCSTDDVTAYHVDGGSSSALHPGDLLRQRLIAQSYAYLAEKHFGRRRVYRKGFAYFFSMMGCFILGRVERAQFRFLRFRGTVDYLLEGPKVLRWNALACSKQRPDDFC